MAKETVHMKIRVLIKAYLVFNKGKKCTSKEISEWINSGWFGLNRSLVNANVIGRLINANRFTSSNITGREHVYHTCRHSQKTVKNDFTILFRFCELENLEDLK